MAAESYVQDHHLHQTRIRIISLNCWGLKYISKHRRERLHEIGRRIAAADPQPQIVGLQECWTQEDYLAIRESTQTILPYGKFYYSGFFGAGLVILSSWPIEESSMYAYPLNGRPAAFFRGDWYVGKGVACAQIRIGPDSNDVVEVFCTHLHAPYEAEHKDSYACHRTAQAWEIAKLMRHAAERGHMVIGLGDFNMVPSSLAYRVIVARSPVQDVWAALKGGIPEGAESKLSQSVRDCIERHGVTCDSALNTWRWSKQMRKELDKGVEPTIDMDAPDDTAKRLDYIFFCDSSAQSHRWVPTSVQVGMMSRHKTLNVSLSDHFSVEATLTRQSLNISRNDGKPDEQTTNINPAMSTSEYDEILLMSKQYMQRERAQQFWQLLHFWVSVAASIACLGAIWRSNLNWVAFILALASTLLLSTGMLDGLLGGLFVRQELGALKEFLWEVENAKQALDA